MAPLSTEARAARLEARRARSDAYLLKLALRENLACSREQLKTARAASDRTMARLATPLPSPWSELAWFETYDMLDRTLVPVD